jgi:hypothetical protein
LSARERAVSEPVRERERAVREPETETETETETERRDKREEERERARMYVGACVGRNQTTKSREEWEYELKCGLQYTWPWREA